MADKSQRNQFKKKVTTCPLLLSLFLLGTIKATTEDATTNYETKVNVKMLSAAGTGGYWKAGATPQLVNAASSNAPWDRAGCYTACKALAAAGKHTACTHTQVFTLTPADPTASPTPIVASVALVNKCEHFESTTATSAVFFDPLIHSADTVTNEVTTKTVSWVWNIQSDAPSNDASELQEAVKKYVGVPKIEGTYSTSISPAGLQGAQEPTGLYLYFGNKEAAGNLVDQSSTTNGYKAAVPASGIWQAVADTAVIKTRVGAPPVGPKITTAAVGTTTAEQKDSGVPASGLYALLGNEAIASVGTAGALGTTDAVAASGLSVLVGTPAAGQTTLFEAIGAPVVPGEPVGATQVSGGTSLAKNQVKSTGLYKHIGDAAADSSAYVAASGSGLTAVLQANAKDAVVASGLYKSIADKAVTSCPTEAQIKEVIKTTEPKAPADGAEARFAATLLASAAALAALV